MADPPQIMTFRPTAEEFQDFSGYIKFMESKGAHLAGLAKVIPPPGWRPRQNLDYDNDPAVLSLTIAVPIRQEVIGDTARGSGVYHVLNMQQKSMKVGEYKQVCPG